MAYVRTLAHRSKQAEAVRRWKPWERSTGPTTPEGKARSAANGDHGSRCPPEIQAQRKKIAALEAELERLKRKDRSGRDVQRELASILAGYKKLSFMLR